MAAAGSYSPRPLVCVLAGQSDMVGRGLPDELPPSLVDDVAANDVQFLYTIDQGSHEGAASSTDGRKFARMSPTAQYSNAGQRHSFGPEWGLAERFLSEFSEKVPGERRPIFMIKFASGSTSLGKDWSPSGDLFAGLVDLVQEGVRQIALGRCGMDDGEGTAEEATAVEQARLLQEDTVFFWLQGHSDASGNVAMRSGYRENFTQFVLALRKALLPDAADNNAAPLPAPALNFPIVASELDWLLDENSKSSVRFAKRLVEINLALRTACEALAERNPPIPTNFASFPQDDDWALTYHEDGHCASLGLLALGRNMATKLLTVNPQLLHEDR